MTVATTDDQLSETFAALANPTRRAILAHLVRGEANVNELAEPFEMTLPAVSRHIKVLERAGLVTQGQRAQYRPCHVWEARFDRMDDYIHQLQTKSKSPTQTDPKDRRRND